MREKPKMKTVEQASYLVKAQAYQARSDLEETIAIIDSIAATVFLGDRQLANQMTGTTTQQIDLVSREITTDENIIISLDHSLEIRAKLLEHRCYLNSMLVEINLILLGIAEKRNKINELRITANLVTARLNAELGDELERIKSDKDFHGLTRRFEDGASLENLCAEKAGQNSQDLDSLTALANASSELREKVLKVQDAAKEARNIIRKPSS
jgi:hypothetical protein